MNKVFTTTTKKMIRKIDEQRKINCLTTKAFDLYKFNYIQTNKGVEHIRTNQKKKPKLVLLLVFNMLIYSDFDDAY